MFIQLFLCIGTLFVYLWFKEKSRSKGLPPGPLRLPILGSIIQLYRADPHYPHLALAKLAAKYGDIMIFGFGISTAVIISSHEMAKDVFKCNEVNLGRFEFPCIVDRNHGKNLGIIFSHGQTWVDIRRFTMKVLKQFGHGNPNFMDQALTESANQLIDFINMELSDSANGIYLVHSHKFSVHVVNVLWNMVGGYKFEPNDELLMRNMELTDKFTKIVGQTNPYNAFPFLKDWFPNLMRYPEHLEVYKEHHEYIKALIKDAKERRSLRLDSEPTSFIEVFLDKIEMHHADPNTIFTNEQLEIIIEDLFLGGSETTGTVLNWSILFLVQNPDIQKKLRQTIFDKIKGRTGNLQSMELMKMPYLKATILEILRMGNVVPIPVPRYVSKDMKIKNYAIPKGSALFFNLHPMFNDKSFWEDPENFRPERFLNESGQIDQKRADRLMSSVFGFGSRVCFGQKLAENTLFVFLAVLIMSFEFHSIPGQEPSAEDPVVGGTIGPRKYCVKVTEATT